MIKINLLPKEARKRVGLGEQIVIIVLVLLLNFGGIGFYWSYLNGVIEQKQEDIARTKERLQELQKILDEINDFEAQRLALKQKLDIIAKLEKEQQLPVHLLDEIYLTLEEDMWLGMFAQQGEDIRLSGMALSNPVVSNYVRNLEQSQYFENIELISVSETLIGDQTVRNFEVNMKLKSQEEPQEEEEAPQQ